MSPKKLISDLAPGDSVIHAGGGYSSFPTVRKVERVTASQVILDNGQRFNRSQSPHAYARGYRNHFHCPSIRTASPEELKETQENHRRQVLIGEISRHEWEKVPLAKLKAIQSILTREAE